MRITIEAIDNGWLVEYPDTLEYPAYGDMMECDTRRRVSFSTPEKALAFVKGVMKKTRFG